MNDRRVVIPVGEVFARHKATFDALPSMGVNPFLVLYFIVDQAFSTKNVPVQILMSDEHELPQAVLSYLTETLEVDISNMSGDDYFNFAAAVNDFHRAILSVRDAALVGFEDAVLKHGERIEWLNNGLVVSLRERINAGTFFRRPN